MLGGRYISDYAVIPLQIPLLAPFKTASAAPAVIKNFAISIGLNDGSEGWGEVAVLPPITAEPPAEVPELARRELTALCGRNAEQWRLLAHELDERIPQYPAIRAGIEMALLDALTRSYGLPLQTFFGGCAAEVTTDITIPICAADDARRLAATYRRLGFTTLKVKIGLDLDADIQTLLAICAAFPDARLILDANAGYTADDTLRLLQALRQANIVPALLEQPVPREDWEGLARLTRETGIPVAADESCRLPADVIKIQQLQAAHAVNIKFAKSGVVTAMQIAETARSCGLDLMLGGMVESRLGMGFSAHYAGGCGGFRWIDLDTPLLFKHDPIQGGCRIVGSRYLFDESVPGHGACLAPGREGAGAS